MGCGASNDKQQPPQARRHDQEDMEDEEDDQDASDVRSNASTKSVNRFTTVYASKVLNERVPYYQPSSPAPQKEEDALWNKQLANLSQPAAAAPVVEDFVFGDFKVDPDDVMVQRRERINRHRAEANGVRRLSRGRNGSFTGGKPAEPAAGTMMFNDFTFKIDETDEFMKGFEEKPLPKGFRQLRRFKLVPMSGHNTRVKTVAIAPHEKSFVSASMEDSSIALYNTETGEETASFVAHHSPIIAACFSRDGKYMATSSRDNLVIVWDVASTKESAKKQVRSFPHDSLPICCTFSHDGVYLVTGCQSKVCIVFDIARSETAFTYSEHDGVVVCIAAHMSSSMVASGGGDRVIRLWDYTTAETQRQFIGHDGVVISLTFTPDGEKLLSNDDRAVKMWKVDTGACILNVTLESLSKSIHPSREPPKPLPRTFFEKHKIRPFGLTINGILGPQALSACRIAANRTVFTLSCLCPGELANSYFAVASTNKIVYIVSQVTGKEEISFVAKSAVFAIASGRGNKLLFGDIFGNMYKAQLDAATTVPESPVKGGKSGQYSRF